MEERGKRAVRAVISDQLPEDQAAFLEQPVSLQDPELDARRIANVRSRSASSIRSFSAIGRAAARLRKVRLLSRIWVRSSFIFTLGIVARTAPKRQPNHDA